MKDLKLFNVEHLYYCGTSDYSEYNSWNEFYNEFKDSDFNLNLVFRWDWHKQDLEEDKNDKERIDIFFVAQRKGRIFSCTVFVNREDEPAIKEWLISRWEYMKKLWEPFE